MPGEARPKIQEAQERIKRDKAGDKAVRGSAGQAD